MTKQKLLGLSFLIAFVSTSILCGATGHPLIFSPVSYKITDFILFGILIGVLCFGLVYITLPFLNSIRRRTRLKTALAPFYIIGTILILQALTLLLGYLESFMTRGVDATFFYYYKGVGNSLIYILTGNATSIIIASIHSKEQLILENERKDKFDFEV